MPRSIASLPALPSRSPSPRSSASQAPPNPRHDEHNPTPRVNIHPPRPPPETNPFKGISKILRSSSHARGRSESKIYDIDRSNIPVNVKDRVRKWQEAVSPAEGLGLGEMPPISPATPTPGKRVARELARDTGPGPSRLGREMSARGARPMSMVETRERILSPPRAPGLVGKPEWDSASEAEKEAERIRAKSRDRERRLNRRRNARPGSSGLPGVEGAREMPTRRGTVVREGSVPAVRRGTSVREKSAPPTVQRRGTVRVEEVEPGVRRIEIIELPRPVMPAAKDGPGSGSEGSWGTAEDDGIRVTPIRKERRRSSNATRRKRNQEEREARARAEAERVAEEKRGKEVAPAEPLTLVELPDPRPAKKDPEPPKQLPPPPQPAQPSKPAKPPIDLAEVLRPLERPKASTTQSASRLPEAVLSKIQKAPLPTPLAQYQVERWDDEAPEDKAPKSVSSATSSAPRKTSYDDGIRVTPGPSTTSAPVRKSFDDGIRVTPSEPKPSASTTTRKTDDGIRVYGSPPTSPPLKYGALGTSTAARVMPSLSSKIDPVIRSGPAYRKPSVRQSARSVKSRKEEFEAQMGITDGTKKKTSPKLAPVSELSRKKEKQPEKRTSDEKLKSPEMKPEDPDAAAARAKMLEEALKPLDPDDGIRVRPLDKVKRTNKEEVKEKPPKREPTPKEASPKAKPEPVDDGIRVAPLSISPKPTPAATPVDDGIRVRPLKDDFDDGIRVKPLRTKKTRKKRSNEKLDKPKPRPQSTPSPLEEIEKLIESELSAEPLQPPKPVKEEVNTESAPATPTGRKMSRRMRRDTEPSTLLSVKDRARMFDRGEPYIIEPVTPGTDRRQSQDNGALKPTRSRSPDDGLTKEERRLRRKEEQRAANEAEEERVKAEQFRIAQEKHEAEKRAKELEKRKSKERVREPVVPARPNRTKSKAKSAENLRREKSKTFPVAATVSTESLPIRLKDTEAEGERSSSRSSKHSRHLSDAAGYQYPELNIERERKTGSPIVPKLAAAAGSFFKIVKEELQGRSVRTAIEVESPDTEEEEKRRPRRRRKRRESESEGSVSVSSELSLTPSESMSEKGRPARRRRRRRRSKKQEESATESESVSESPPPKERRRRRRRSRKRGSKSSREEMRLKKKGSRETISTSESEESRSVSGSEESRSVSEPESAQPKRRRSRRRRRRSRSKHKKRAKSEERSVTASESTVSRTPSPEVIVEKVEKKKSSPKLSPKISPKSSPQPTPKSSAEELKKAPKSPKKSSAESTRPPSPSACSQCDSSASDATARDNSRSPPLKRKSSRSRRRKPSRRPSTRRGQSKTPTPPPPEPEQEAYNLPEVVPAAKPRRRVRDRPAPPRPKSIHSRTGSDGTQTPRTSIYGDDAFSIAETDTSRRVSEASSIKPLRVNKQQKPEHVRTNSGGSDKDREKDKDKDKDNVAGMSSVLEDMGVEDWFNPDASGNLRRKYTKHADLLSILAQEHPEGNLRAPSVRSRRSRRSNRSRRSSRRSKAPSLHEKVPRTVESLTVADLVKELSNDEIRYMRELRTLVEHVVPVLFQTVLGRADDHLKRTSSTSSASTGMSGGSLRSFDANPTRPIVDIGITLERLKSAHEKLGSVANDTDALMRWANDARRVYEEYLSVWRMGFQDVVISMGDKKKADEEQRQLEFKGDPSTWAMPPPPEEDEEKDEKVDVAFLLKRPLVRLKALAKLFKRIHYLTTSPVALSLSNGFYDLVTVARKKISEEKARIEDEVAAGLDTSKTIDIRKLLPRPDTQLDQSRRVKARDSFNMRLYHSSGDVITKPIELILRDPSPRHRSSEAEVLIVETGEGTSKWLCFQPVAISNISARIGDAHREIVVMVRGKDSDGEEWREVMALDSESAAGFEWIQMLGMEPVPPEGPFSEEFHEPAYLDTVIEESEVSSRPPVKMTAKKQRKQALESSLARMETRKAQRMAEAAAAAAAAEKEAAEGQAGDNGEIVQFTPPEWLPHWMTAIPDPPLPDWQDVGGRFTIPEGITFETLANIDELYKESIVRRTPSLHTLSDASSLKSGSLQRSRRASRPSNASRKSTHLSPEDAADAADGANYSVSETTLRRSKSIHYDEEDTGKKGRKSAKKSPFDQIPVLTPTVNADQAPPPVPPHRSTSPAESTSSNEAPLVAPRAPFTQRRRTSSPLKHSWSPSSSDHSQGEESDSGTEIAPRQQSRKKGEVTDDDETEREYTSDEYSSGSETSSDTESELVSEEEDGSEVEYPPTPLINIPRDPSRKPSLITLTRAKSVLSTKSKKDDSSTVIAPIPEGNTAQPAPDGPPPPVPTEVGHAFKATLFKWGTKEWDKVLPGEVKIVVTPGYMEAFPLVASPDGYGVPQIGGTGMLASMQKLLWSIGLNHELSYRRGTAVDICIRTPPASYFGGANIMLRSASPADCTNLWNAITDNTIRPPHVPEPTMISTVVPSEMGTSVTSSTTFGGTIKRGFAWTRGRSYRAGSTTPNSIISTPSQTSLTSFSSAISRLKPGFLKNGALSSVASSTTSFMGSRGAPPIELSEVVDIGTWVIAMQPLRMHLFKRESHTKWRDMGSARLHVLKPPAVNSWDQRKRVVVTNKKGDVVYIDQALGEEAFERTGRTGLAVNILTGEGREDGSVGHTGGIGAKNLVYMLQMKSEAEASYSFNILGKLRY